MESRQQGKLKKQKTYVKNEKQKPSIPFSLCLYAHKNRSSELRKLHLNELLENSHIVLQELILPTRDPELEARIQKLKLEQDNKAYRQMTKNIDKIKYHESSSIRTELKQLNNQLIDVVNFVVTVGGVQLCFLVIKVQDMLLVAIEGIHFQ